MPDPTWSSLSVDDAADYAGLLAAAEAVDQQDEHYSAEDVAEELSDPALDLPRDSWAVRVRGRLVAGGVVLGSSEVWDVHSVWAFGVVHPQFRRHGIGAELLTRQLERGAQLHTERHPGVPGLVSMFAGDHIPGAAALARRLGLRPARFFHTMQADLHEAVPTAREPAAPLRVVGFDPARDDEVRRAHNVAFRDHWGSTERDAAAWAQHFTGTRNFSPDLSRLVLDEERVVGYLLGYEFPADTAATGRRDAYEGQLGTLPGARGRGVGSALLTQVLAHAAAVGFDTSSLGVDVDNVTPALALYERVGYRRVRSSTSFVRDLPVAPG